MIFIPGNIPSLKNSKVKTARGIFSSPPLINFLDQLAYKNLTLVKKKLKDM